MTNSGSVDVVDERQRAYFDAYGYLVLSGVFADDIGEIGNAFDDVWADPGHGSIDLKVVGHRFNSHHAMGNFVERHARLTAVVTDPRTQAIAAALLGPGAEFAGSDGSIFCCETEWHYDTPVTRTDRRHVKLAFYLDPLDASGGAPRVLPISHHDPELYRGPLGSYLGFDGAIEARTGRRGEDLPHWVMPSEPGDVLVWDFRLMHGSYGSTRPRRQFALNFCSATPIAAAEPA